MGVGGAVEALADGDLESGFEEGGDIWRGLVFDVETDGADAVLGGGGASRG